MALMDYTRIRIRSLIELKITPIYMQSRLTLPARPMKRISVSKGLATDPDLPDTVRNIRCKAFLPSQLVFTGPQGWTYGIGETQGASQSFASWGALETFNIHPGDSLAGFELKSYGLPGIRELRVEPWVADYVPQDLVDWSQLNAFYQQFTFRSKTIDPVAPKRAFVALEFLNYLISLVHDSRDSNWIEVSGVLSKSARKAYKC
jgi:hypothetical protein